MVFTLEGKVWDWNGGIRIAATTIAVPPKPTNNHQLNVAWASASLNRRASLGMPCSALYIAAHQRYFNKARDAPTINATTVSQYQGRRTGLESAALIARMVGCAEWGPFAPAEMFAIRKKPGPLPSISLRFLLRDPFVRARFQKIERQRSAVEHLVVKGADIELGSQFFLGAVAKVANL